MEPTLEQPAKRRDVHRVVNYILAAAFLASCIGMLLTILITGEDPDNRTFASIGSALLFVAPFVLEQIFNRRLGNYAMSIYLVFVFFAAAVGSVFNLCTTFPGYDKVLHSVFGYVGALAGLFVLCRLADVKSLRPALIVIVCFSVSMMCGGVWEMMEFISDTLLGQTSQGVPIPLPDGGTVVDVKDTVFDLVSNFGGALAFCLHYIVHRAAKKNLLLGSIEADFSKPTLPARRKKIAAN